MKNIDKHRLKRDYNPHHHNRPMQTEPKTVKKSDFLSQSNHQNKHLVMPNQLAYLQRVNQIQEDLRYLRLPRLGTLIDSNDPVQSALETMDCVIELISQVKVLRKSTSKIQQNLQ